MDLPQGKDLLRDYNTPQTGAEKNASAFTAYLMLAVLAVVAAIAATASM